MPLKVVEVSADEKIVLVSPPAARPQQPGSARVTPGCSRWATWAWTLLTAVIAVLVVAAPASASPSQGRHDRGSSGHGARWEHADHGGGTTSTTVKPTTTTRPEPTTTTVATVPPTTAPATTTTEAPATTTTSTTVAVRPVIQNTTPARIFTSPVRTPPSTPPSAPAAVIPPPVATVPRPSAPPTAPPAAHPTLAPLAGTVQLVSGTGSSPTLLPAMTNLQVPIIFSALIGTFLLVQAVVGRRDPRLAQAPARGDDDSIPFE